ncbi:rCG22363 [Rattus norvegicus]|uniref:RCG22363 n=1 Tax=Rattus norvegicus TaxID=10116 RepID=A6INQ9_RAT|nr:rCG22363 [Rattus norvegicus]
MQTSVPWQVKGELMNCPHMKIYNLSIHKHVDSTTWILGFQLDS